MSVGFTLETAPPAIEDLRRRLSLLPGVEAVGVMDRVPLAGERGHLVTDHLEGYAAPSGGQIEFGHATVGPGCFRALGIPVIEGRDISESDWSTHRPVMLVNESLGQKFWPNQAVVGKQIQRLGKSYDVIFRDPTDA